MATKPRQKADKYFLSTAFEHNWTFEFCRSYIAFRDEVSIKLPTFILQVSTTKIRPIVVIRKWSIIRLNVYIIAYFTRKIAPRIFLLLLP